MSSLHLYLVVPYSYLSVFVTLILGHSLHSSMCLRYTYIGLYTTLIYSVYRMCFHLHLYWVMYYAYLCVLCRWWKAILNLKVYKNSLPQLSKLDLLKLLRHHQVKTLLIQRVMINQSQLSKLWLRKVLSPLQKMYRKNLSNLRRSLNKRSQRSFLLYVILCTLFQSSFNPIFTFVTLCTWCFTRLYLIDC